MSLQIDLGEFYSSRGNNRRHVSVCVSASLDVGRDSDVLTRYMLGLSPSSVMSRSSVLLSEKPVEGEQKELEKCHWHLEEVDAIKGKLAKEHGQLRRTKNWPRPLKFMVQRGGAQLLPKQEPEPAKTKVLDMDNIARGREEGASRRLEDSKSSFVGDEFFDFSNDDPIDLDWMSKFLTLDESLYEFP
ncbi:hypothetical protein OIU79_003621 [Salix purpurea]|uniref:Uncharacterized protein n=1 Tax=Salix purpurea TaxID=77065 RepID=A0A9Q0ULX5_SALPP|nr:hypothetical protein OIU79_003621 [Salix purpurea]